jgi:hypothetical protein
MDDVSDDSDDLQESAIICATFPSVIKKGDENGDSTHLTNVVLKAKVLLSDTEQLSA